MPTIPGVSETNASYYSSFIELQKMMVSSPGFLCVDLMVKRAYVVFKGFFFITFQSENLHQPIRTWLMKILRLKHSQGKSYEYYVL